MNLGTDLGSNKDCMIKGGVIQVYNILILPILFSSLLLILFASTLNVYRSGFGRCLWVGTPVMFGNSK